MTRVGLGALAAVALALAGCPDARAPSRGDPTAVLVEAALADDPAVRQRALDLLLERRDAEAVDRLSTRLEGADAQVVTRVLEAFETLEDERAVPPLIDLSRITDRRFTPRVVRAIGRVGGEEAEAYLFTLETGAEEASVREAAAAARAAMARRARAEAAADMGAQGG